jgi:hypothetical protein
MLVNGVYIIYAAKMEKEEDVFQLDGCKYSIKKKLITI